MASSGWLMADGKFRFEKLEIWQIAVEIIQEVYAMTKTFPKEEMFGIISQLHRAAVSIASNIAEGSGGRSSQDFKRFLDISIGSVLETASLILVSEKLGFIRPDQGEETKQKLLLLMKKIYAFKKTI